MNRADKMSILYSVKLPVETSQYNNEAMRTSRGSGSKPDTPYNIWSICFYIYIYIKYMQSNQKQCVYNILYYWE